MTDTRRGFLTIAGAGLLGQSQPLLSKFPAGERRRESNDVTFLGEGDARHGPQGWQGRDDTKYLNEAISQLAARGGGDLVIRKRHFVSSAVGKLSLGLDSITAPSLEYAIRLRPGVRIIFEGGGGIYSNESTTSSKMKLACFGIEKSDGQFPVRISGGTVSGFFVGIAFTETTAVNWLISDLTITACSIGILGRTFEQCSFRDIYLLQCCAGIVIGGFYRYSLNEYSETGGFADKCLFSNIRSVLDCNLDSRAEVIDKWFDDNVFMTIKNTNLSGPGNSGPARSFPYTGICGYGIRMMSRYARPNNSNVFDILSHANGPRSAIHIDAGRGNSAQSIYTENLGYADWKRRSFPIGLEKTDPYLGVGKRMPFLVKGVSSIASINAQHCFAERVTDSAWLGSADLSSSRFAQNSVAR
ncbi:hypothetical protein ACFSGX_02365 [Sphingomonas arantia]|uniref:Pectate lyase superfamily protein domain-containing protein n=2 Tax=Sphingomonas arantia TaxID=1460676 RepID=A0ABW4TSG1_9SPHN